MIYLSEKTGGKLIPKDPVGRYKCLEWMMFQMGGVGPMFGQCNHFANYAVEKMPYAIERYTNEVARLQPGARQSPGRGALARRRRIQHGRHHHLPVDPQRRPVGRSLRRARHHRPRRLSGREALARCNGGSPRGAARLAVLADGRGQAPITDAEHEIMFGKTQFAVR